MRARRTIAASSAFIAFVASGCAALAPAPPEPAKEVLDAQPHQVPQAPVRGGVLVVAVAHGLPWYDTTAIAYRTPATDLAYYARHEWADTPAHMLLPLVLRTLERTQAFTTVVAPPYFGRVQASLRVEIDELLADFTAPGAAVRLSLRATLRDEAGRVATRTITVDAPIGTPTPDGVARAANDAAAQALTQLAAFAGQACSILRSVSSRSTK